MTGSPTRLLKFGLERWIQRGLVGQLLIVSGLIVLVALGGGLAAWLATSHFPSLADALWWSFLRLSDPGYLGEDEGPVLRAISIAVTLVGYVLFTGSLIAIMTQWLAVTLRRLESGLTPITMKDHVVILGCNERTPEIIARLLGARGRLTRFLQSRDVRHARVVILADAIDAAGRQALREALGAQWDERRILLRSGSALHPDDLLRLDLLRAAVIVVPGDARGGGSSLADTRVVKTLLTLEQLFASVPEAERPLVVAEIGDPLKLPIARGILAGPHEIIASDVVLSRLLAQSVRHGRLARVLLALLSHGETSSFYLRGFPELAGASPLGLDELFPHAVVLGVVRREHGTPRAWLNPPPDFRLAADDLLVLVAPSYAACTRTDGSPRQPLAVERQVSASQQGASGRLLVLGWSRKLLGVAAELGRPGSPPFQVCSVSLVPRVERERADLSAELDPALVQVTHVEADYTVLPQLQRLDPGRFEHVLFLASTRLDATDENDARTVLGYVLLKSLLAGETGESADGGPEILVELLDPENARLFPRSSDVLLLSQRVLSQILVQVALRPELNAVFDELFVAGGMEIRLRSSADYGLVGQTLEFAAIRRAARTRGEVALGVLPAGGRGGLDQEAARSWTLEPEDRIAVLAS